MGLFNHGQEPPVIPAVEGKVEPTFVVVDWTVGSGNQRGSSEPFLILLEELTKLINCNKGLVSSLLARLILSYLVRLYGFAPQGVTLDLHTRGSNGDGSFEGTFERGGRLYYFKAIPF